jgi:hypothetical protein
MVIRLLVHGHSIDEAAHSGINRGEIIGGIAIERNDDYAVYNQQHG